MLSRFDTIAASLRLAHFEPLYPMDGPLPGLLKILHIMYRDTRYMMFFSLFLSKIVLILRIAIHNISIYEISRSSTKTARCFALT